jgi:hypothetical protein
MSSSVQPLELERCADSSTVAVVQGAMTELGGGQKLEYSIHSVRLGSMRRLKFSNNDPIIAAHLL